MLIYVEGGWCPERGWCVVEVSRRELGISTSRLEVEAKLLLHTMKPKVKYKYCILNRTYYILRLLFILS